MRKKLTSWLCLSLACTAWPAAAMPPPSIDEAAIARSLEAVPRPKVPAALAAYNQVETPEAFRLVESDIGAYATAFGAPPFRCEALAHHLPKEHAKAQQAFERFLREFDATQHEGVTVEDKRRRLAMMGQAKAAGSWQARFTDVMWDLWDNRQDTRRAKRSSDALMAMAQQGQPLALQALVQWTQGSLSPDEQVPLIRAGIDRGAPRLMAEVGHRLAFNTLTYRAQGVAMLQCAVAQGNVDAFYSLGMIFYAEGRWVDAYQLWEQGLNLGCDRCGEQLESVAMLKPDFVPGRDGTTNAVPQINELQAFYERQLFWKLTGLPGVYHPAPASMHFHLTPTQLEAILKMDLARAEARLRTSPRPGQ